MGYIQGFGYIHIYIGVYGVWDYGIYLGFRLGTALTK